MWRNFQTFSPNEKSPTRPAQGMLSIMSSLSKSFWHRMIWEIYKVVADVDLNSETICMFNAALLPYILLVATYAAQYFLFLHLVLMPVDTVQ